MVGDAVWEKIAPLLPGKASDPTGAARPELNRIRAQEAHRGPGPESRAMSVLRNPHPQATSSHPFMTQ